MRQRRPFDYQRDAVDLFARQFPPVVGVGRGVVLPMTPKQAAGVRAHEAWRRRQAACPTCGGSGMQPSEPQPDSFGNYTPCDDCDGTGQRQAINRDVPRR